MFKRLITAACLALAAFASQATTLVYDSFLDDVMAGNIVKTDTFKCVLTTSAYTENRGTHTKRSDVTNEVSGTGYTAGGASTTLTVTKDTTNHRVTLTIGSQSYASSTISARKQVCYKSRGGASSADELVFVNDFGSDVTSTAGTFTVNASTIHFNTP